MPNDVERAAREMLRGKVVSARVKSYGGAQRAAIWKLFSTAKYHERKRDRYL